MKGTACNCRKISLSDFDSMPIRLVNTIEIAVTPLQLFTSFEAEQDWGQWVPVVKRMRWTSPPPFKIGSTREVEMTGGSIGAEEFIAWEAGKRMAFRFNSTSASGVLALGEDYQIEETAQGCRLCWIMVLDLTGYKAVILSLLKPIVRWNQRRYLNTLKAMLEARHPGTV